MTEEERKSKNPEEKFCYECGAVIRAKAEICPKCGVRQPFLGSLGMTLPGNILAQGQPRSRVVAGLLALFGGGVGLHKFYLGKPGWGVLYIILLCTGISVLLGLIEGVYLLTMSDENFERRYAGPAWIRK